MDWKQLWQILSAADNVPTIPMIPLLAFYTYPARKQAQPNDVIIAELEGNARADQRRIHGDGVYRHQPIALQLLHLEAAQICHWNFSLRLHHPVGLDDFHRRIYSRPRMAVVLARADLGPQPAHL